MDIFGVCVCVWFTTIMKTMWLFLAMLSAKKILKFFFQKIRFDIIDRLNCLIQSMFFSAFAEKFESIAIEIQYWVMNDYNNIVKKNEDDVIMMMTTTKFFLIFAKRTMYSSD